MLRVCHNCEGTVYQIVVLLVRSFDLLLHFSTPYWVIIFTVYTGEKLGVWEFLNFFREWKRQDS